MDSVQRPQTRGSQPTRLAEQRRSDANERQRIQHLLGKEHPVWNRSPHSALQFGPNEIASDQPTFDSSYPRPQGVRFWLCDNELHQG